MTTGKARAGQHKNWTHPPNCDESVLRPQSWMVLKALAAVVVCCGVVLYLGCLIKAHTPLWVFVAAELAFCVHYWCIRVPFFTSLALRQGPDEHDAQYIKARLLEQLMRVDDIMACMESWFLEAGPGDVKKDNLKELFAYAIWYKSLGEMEAEGLMPELDDLMQQLEAKYGRRVPSGYNPDLRFMSHLWEPLRHIYRPLLVYVVMELLTLLCHVVLLATGFKLQELDGITYYTLRTSRQRLVPAISASMKRSRSSSAALASAANPTSHNRSSSNTEDLSKVPIVFLHGVGAGLLPYLTVIFRLAALGQPMILPHSRHVSMRIVSWIPTVDDMADATAAMLSAHGFSRAAVVAHSYGTMVASRLVLKYPQLVHSMCLTDPVCFAMFMPNLLRNFLYARHSSGCWWLDAIMRLVASELHCCANFSRKFFWSSINLWDEHIPERTLVVLGGQDILAPAAQVDRWLREHTHAQVMYEPTMHHAGMLLSMSWQLTILTNFVHIMNKPSGQGSADGSVYITPAAEDAIKQPGSDTATAAAAATADKLRTAVPPVATNSTAAVLQHICSHPYNRLCSDCLMSCQQLTQGLAADLRVFVHKATACKAAENSPGIPAQGKGCSTEQVPLGSSSKLQLSTASGLKQRRTCAPQAAGSCDDTDSRDAVLAV